MTLQKPWQCLGTELMKDISWREIKHLECLRARQRRRRHQSIKPHVCVLFGTESCTSIQTLVKCQFLHDTYILYILAVFIDSSVVAGFQNMKFTFSCFSFFSPQIWLAQQQIWTTVHNTWRYSMRFRFKPAAKRMKQIYGTINCNRKNRYKTLWNPAVLHGA